MKRTWIIALALVVASGFGVSAAWAGPGCSGHNDVKSASASCCTAGDFPKMVMTVGDKTFDCPVAAEKAAKEGKSKIIYAVAGEKFECKDKATEALACAAECYMKRFTSIATVVDGKVLFASDKSCSSSCSSHGSDVKTASATGEKKACCMSKDATAKAGGCGSHASFMTQSQIDAEVKNAKVVKYLVAGRSFDCPKEAAKARDDAMAAIKTVSMKYIVDGKEVGSSSDVCPLAKMAGKVQYMVNGEKTPCETTARISLAKAQYEAATKKTEKKVAAM
jgi:hypothetical protein